MHINSINAVSSAPSNLKRTANNRMESPVEQPIGQDTVSFQGKVAPAKARNALLGMLALVGIGVTATSCAEDKPEDVVVVTTSTSTYPGGYTTNNYTVNIDELKRSPNQYIGDSIKVGTSYLNNDGNAQYIYNKMVVKGFLPQDAVGLSLTQAQKDQLGIQDGESYRILRNGTVIKSDNATIYNWEVNQTVELHMEYMDSILAELRNMNGQINNMQGQLNDITSLLQLMASYLNQMNNKLDSLSANQLAQYNLINSTYADWLAHWTQYTNESRAFRLNLMQTIVQYGDDNNNANAQQAQISREILDAVLAIYPYLNDMDNNILAGFNALLNRWDLSDANVRAMALNLIQHMDLHDANRTQEAGEILAAISNLHGDVTTIKNAVLSMLSRMQNFSPELLAKLNTIIANQGTMINNQNTMDANQRQGFADVIDAINNITPASSNNYDAKLDRIIELLFDGNGLLTQYGNSLLARFDNLIPILRNGFASVNANIVNYGDATLEKMDDLSGQLAQMDANRQAEAAAELERLDTIIARLDRMELAEGDIANRISNLNIGGGTAPAVDLSALELLVNQIAGKMDQTNSHLADLNVTAQDVKAILEAMKDKLGQFADQNHQDLLAILDKIKDPVTCNCADCCERIIAFLTRYNEGQGDFGDIFNRE